MKLPLRTRIYNFFFEFDSLTVPAKVSTQGAASPQAAPAAPAVPEFDEKPHLVSRLYDMMYQKNYRGGTRDDLREFDIETLRYMLACPRINDFYPVLADKHRSEESVRSVLYLMGRKVHDAFSGDAIADALDIVELWHPPGFGDLTKQDDLTVARVSAVVRVLTESGYRSSIPPQLTHYTMQHPHRAEDILDFIKEFHPTVRTILHSFDLSHLEDYLAADAKVLREGFI